MKKWKNPFQLTVELAVPLDYPSVIAFLSKILTSHFTLDEVGAETAGVDVAAQDHAWTTISLAGLFPKLWESASKRKLLEAMRLVIPESVYGEDATNLIHMMHEGDMDELFVAPEVVQRVVDWAKAEFPEQVMDMYDEAVKAEKMSARQRAIIIQQRARDTLEHHGWTGLTPPEDWSGDRRGVKGSDRRNVVREPIATPSRRDTD